jgi:hypothetical protein
VSAGLNGWPTEKLDFFASGLSPTGSRPMVVLVLSRLGHPLSQFVAKHSVAGDSLMERMRSTTFALLGLATAVGLGLVAFVSYQGWSGVLTSPIPSLPVERHAVQDGTAAARPVIASTGGVAVHAATVAAPSTRSRAPGAESAGSGISGSHRVVAPPTPQPGSGEGQPSGQGAAGTAPPAQQPSSAPAPASTPTAPSGASSPATSPDSHASLSKSHGMGNAYGRNEGHSRSQSEGRHSGSHAHSSPTEPSSSTADSGYGTVESTSSTKGKRGDPEHGHGQGQDQGHAHGHDGG